MPPYDSANLADHVGDDDDTVAGNRLALSESVGISHDWATLRQIHSARVVTESQARRGDGEEADGVVLGAGPAAIFTADCIPLLLVAGAAEKAEAVLVHAGWRGLERGVVESGIGKLAEAVGRQRSPAGHRTRLMAFIGPSIRACCYEVSEEIAARFLQRFGPGVLVGERNLDLQEVARRIIGGSDPDAGIVDLGPCTAESEHLFSYRRDGPFTGRQALVAWRVG